jgi:hypothetical protein
MLEAKTIKNQTQCACGRPLDNDMMWNGERQTYACGVCWRRDVANKFESMAREDLRRARKLREEAAEIENAGRKVEIACQS